MLRSLNCSHPVKDDSNLNHHSNLNDIDLQKNLSVTMRNIEFVTQNLSHAFSFGNVSKSTHQFIDVAAFKHKIKVFHNGFVAVQMFNNIKHGQIRNFNFIGHLLILKNRSQALRVGNIRLLACFIAAAKHDNHYIAALHIIHSPTTTKMFTHFKNTFANWFDVAKIPVFNSFKPTSQATTHNAIFKTMKPFSKFGKLSDCDFHLSHINNLTPTIKLQIHLTQSNTQTKMTAPQYEVGRGNPFRQGDKTPQLKAVFFCPSFFHFPDLGSAIHIMMGLFGQSLRLVAPCRGISTPFNPVTSIVENICDGYPTFRQGITA